MCQFSIIFPLNKYYGQLKVKVKTSLALTYPELMAESPSLGLESLFHINCVVDQILKLSNVEFSYFWE